MTRPAYCGRSRPDYRLQQTRLTEYAARLGRPQRQGRSDVVAVRVAVPKSMIEA